MKNSASVEPRVFDVQQAAAYIGVSTWTLRTLISDGVIATVQPPSVRRRGERIRRVLIDRATLDQLVETWRTT